MIRKSKHINMLVIVLLTILMTLTVSAYESYWISDYTTDTIGLEVSLPANSMTSFKIEQTGSETVITDRTLSSKDYETPSANCYDKTTYSLCEIVNPNNLPVYRFNLTFIATGADLTSDADSIQVTQLDGVVYDTTLADKQIAEWTFDNSLVDNVQNIVGSNNGATQVIGESGYAYDFVEANEDYINIGNIPNPVASNAMTISAWINPDSITGQNAILDKFSSTLVAGEDWGFYLESGELVFYIYSASLAQSSVAVNTDEWSHVVGSTDGSTVKVYVNGILRGTDTHEGADAFTAYSLDTYIGWAVRGGTSLPFDGQIDDVKIFYEAVTDGSCSENVTCGGDIATLYNGGVKDTTTDFPYVSSSTNFDTSDWSSYKDLSVGYRSETYTSDANTVLYYPFSDSNTLGTTYTPVIDEASTNDGTVTGATSSDGVIGSGMFFDGSDYLTISASSDFNFGTGDFVYSFWLKTTGEVASTGTIDTIFSDVTTTSSADYSTIIGWDVPNDRYQFYTFTDASWHYSESIYPINSWNHIVMTRISGIIYIYIDGLLIDSWADSGNIGSSTKPYTFFKQFHTSQSNGEGEVDEIIITDDGWTASEVWSYYQDSVSTYNAEPTSNLRDIKLMDYDEDLVLYMQFENDAIDSGWYDYDGTNTGAVYTASGKIGGAYDFERDDGDYIQLPLITGDFNTMMFWMKPEQTITTAISNQMPLSEVATSIYLSLGSVTSGCTNELITLQIGASSVDCWTSTSLSDFTAATWYHIALVWDPTAVEYILYVDGIKIGGADILTGTGDLWTDVTMKIAYYNGVSNSYDGLLDEIKIYKKSMTDQEVYQEYLKTSPDSITSYFGTNFRNDLKVIADSKLVPFQWVGIVDATSSFGTQSPCEAESYYWNGTTCTIPTRIRIDTETDLTETSDNYDYKSYQALYDNSGLTTPILDTLLMEVKEVGLVAGYNLDGNAVDYVGSNDGTINSATLTKGLFKSAIHFDEVNDYIDLDSLSTELNSNQQGTFCNWVKTTETTFGAYHLSHNNYASGSHGALGINQDLIFYEWNTACNPAYSRMNTPATINDGDWHHVCWSSNGITNKIYVDGVDKALTVTSGSNTGVWFGDSTCSPDTVTLGALHRNSGDSLFFNGDVDKALYYNRALSSQEIKSQYEDGLGVMQNDLTQPLYTVIGLEFLFNIAPTMLSSSISPSTAYTNDMLLTYCKASDDDANNLVYYYDVYKNDGLYYSGVTGSYTHNITVNVYNISSVNTTKGDDWILECTAYDSTSNSSALNSSTLTISNSIPSINDVSILPSIAYTNDTLLGYCNASDTDNDSLSYFWEWYRNGVLNFTGNTTTENRTNTTSISGWEDSGDDYNSTTDGNWSSYGTALAGSSAVHSYDKPTGAVGAVWKVKDGVGTAEFRLSEECWSYYSDRLEVKYYSKTISLDDDNYWRCLGTGGWETLRTYNNVANAGKIYEEQIRWLYPANNTVSVDNVTIDLTTKNDNWTLSCRAYDEEDYSSWLNSSTLTISNSLPTISNIAYTTSSGGDTYYLQKIINVTASVTDLDGDLQYVEIRIVSPIGTEVYTNMSGSYYYDTSVTLDVVGTWTISIIGHDVVGNTTDSSTTFEVTQLSSTEITITDGFFGYDILNISNVNEIDSLSGYGYTIYGHRINYSDFGTDHATFKTLINYSFNTYNTKNFLTLYFDNGDYSNSTADTTCTGLNDISTLKNYPYLDSMSFIVLETQDIANRATFINRIAQCLRSLTTNNFVIYSKDYNTSLDSSYVSYWDMPYSNSVSETDFINDEIIIIQSKTTLTRIYYDLSTTIKTVTKNYHDNIINHFRGTPTTNSVSGNFGELDNLDLIVYNNLSTTQNISTDHVDAYNYDMWDYTNKKIFKDISGSVDVLVAANSESLLYVDNFSEFFMTTSILSTLFKESSSGLQNNTYSVGEGTSDSTFPIYNAYDAKTELWNPNYVHNNLFFISYELLNYSYTTQFGDYDLIIVAEGSNTPSDVNASLNVTTNPGILNKTYIYNAVSDYNNTLANGSNATDCSVANPWETNKIASITTQIASFDINIFIDGFDIGYSNTPTCFEDRVKRIVDSVRIDHGKKTICNSYTIYESIVNYCDYVMRESCFSRWAGDTGNPTYSYENMSLMKDNADFMSSSNTPVLCMAFGAETDYDKMAYDFHAFAVMYGADGENLFRYGQPDFQTQTDIMVPEIGTMIQNGYDDSDSNDWTRRYSNGIVHFSPYRNYTFDNGEYYWFDNGQTINSFEMDVKVQQYAAGCDNGKDVYVYVNEVLTDRITDQEAGCPTIWSTTTITIPLNSSQYEYNGHYTIRFAPTNRANGVGINIWSRSGTETGVHSYWDTTANNPPTSESQWTAYARTGTQSKATINFYSIMRLNTTSKASVDASISTITQTNTDYKGSSINRNITISSTEEYNLTVLSYPIFINTLSFTSAKHDGNILNISNTTDCTGNNPSFNYTSINGETWGACRELSGTGYYYRFSIPHLSTQEIIIITYSIPVIGSSSILPTIAYTNNTLLGYCNASDVDGDNLYYNYSWYKNGVLNETGVTSSNYTAGEEINIANLTSTNFYKNDNITLECIAYDGINYSTSLNSTTLTISNTLPTFDQSNFSITQGHGSNINLQINVSDLDVNDGEDVLNYSINSTGFTINSSTGLINKTITVAETGTYNFTINVTDSDYMISMWVFYNITNIAPSTNASINNTSPYTNNILSCDNDTTSDGDGDSVTFFYKWYDGASIIGGETSQTLNLNIAGLDKGDNILCEITPYDGFDNGSSVNTSTVTIINALPILNSFTPANASTETDLDVIIQLNASEIDGENLTYYWTFNNVNYNATNSSNYTVVDIGYSTIYYWNVTISDGIGNYTSPTYQFRVQRPTTTQGAASGVQGGTGLNKPSLQVSASKTTIPFFTGDPIYELMILLAALFLGTMAFKNSKGMNKYIERRKMIRMKRR